jgi:hypothetical protein
MVYLAAVTTHRFGFIKGDESERRKNHRDHRSAIAGVSPVAVWHNEAADRRGEAQARTERLARAAPLDLRFLRAYTAYLEVSGLSWGRFLPFGHMERKCHVDHSPDARLSPLRVPAGAR